MDLNGEMEIGGSFVKRDGVCKDRVRRVRSQMGIVEDEDGVEQRCWQMEKVGDEDGLHEIGSTARRWDHRR